MGALGVVGQATRRGGYRRDTVETAGNNNPSKGHLGVGVFSSSPNHGRLVKWHNRCFTHTRRGFDSLTVHAGSIKVSTSKDLQSVKD